MRTNPTAMSSLDKLTRSIQTAVSEIKRLRRENDRLKEKSAKLERRVEASSASTDEEVWRAERSQIRDRMEELVDRLEGVLGES